MVAEAARRDHSFPALTVVASEVGVLAGYHGAGRRKTPVTIQILFKQALVLAVTQFLAYCLMIVGVAEGSHYLASSIGPFNVTTNNA